MTVWESARRCMRAWECCRCVNGPRSSGESAVSRVRQVAAPLSGCGCRWTPYRRWSVADSVRVLLADDHPVYRDGLAALLGSLDGVEVVGTAADGVEAVDGARELQPDVVVMDVQMPRLDGIEATRAI